MPIIETICGYLKKRKKRNWALTKDIEGKKKIDLSEYDNDAVEVIVHRERK